MICVDLLQTETPQLLARRRGSYSYMNGGVCIFGYLANLNSLAYNPEGVH